VRPRQDKYIAIIQMEDLVTQVIAQSVSQTRAGWFSGLMGVVIFSGSLPATRLAVMDFDPVFVTVARAAIAGIIAVLILMVSRPVRPVRSQWGSLMVVAGGVVVGFPLLTALALEHISSARSIVFIGLLPLATAIFGFLRGGERPRAVFWLFSILGSGLVPGLPHRLWRVACLWLCCALGFWLAGHYHLAWRRPMNGNPGIQTAAC
jgi:hypothetical protein